MTTSNTAEVIMLRNSSAPPGVIVPRLIYDDVAAAGNSE